MSGDSSFSPQGYGNAFARLLLNLVAAYENSDADEGSQKVECIWNAYCHHLNAQEHKDQIFELAVRLL